MLLVDHQPTSRKVALHYLVGTWEMRVDVATDGADALAALRAEARALAAGATSCFNPPPSFAVSSTASAVAGASAMVAAIDSPSRASFVARTCHF